MPRSTPSPHPTSPFNAEGLWKAPFLSTRTCRELVEEVQHAEKWSQARGLAVHRPNSMNNYGVILDDFGLSEALQTLTVQYANAFSELLFPHVEASLDSHHGFVVEYEIGKDVKLDFHVRLSTSPSSSSSHAPGRRLGGDAEHLPRHPVRGRRAALWRHPLPRPSADGHPCAYATPT